MKKILMLKNFLFPTLSSKRELLLSYHLVWDKSESNLANNITALIYSYF